MSKPSIAFVPGSFILVESYQPIFDAISEAGYEIKGIRLPSIGPGSRQGTNNLAPSMYDDAATIAREVESLTDHGKDVIIIGHSYGGVPMSQCTKGLGKEERKAQGKPGGIVRLAYMAALVPALGKSGVDILGELPEDTRPSVEVDGNGWALMNDPVKTARIVVQELPLQKGIAIVNAMAKHSARSSADKLTHAGYKDIPVSYLLTENDLCVPPGQAQRPAINMIEQVSGQRVDVVSIKTGHCPNWADPKATVNWILSVIKLVEDTQAA